ncbi:MAG: DinB family protein [Thermoanaerobaculia bacterium]
MRLIDPLLLEFDRECSATRKCLERLPADKLTWKPHEKSMSLGQLAGHVATIPAWIGGALLADGFDLAKGMDRPPVDTVENIVASFETSAKMAKAAMAQLDDAKAMGDWTFSNNGQAVFSMPRIALVRTILLNHAYHHRGQLTVYMRLLDVPVPAIYGPSADDNPFK